jgi:hypothetical protein
MEERSAQACGPEDSPTPPSRWLMQSVRESREDTLPASEQKPDVSGSRSPPHEQILRPTATFLTHASTANDKCLDLSRSWLDKCVKSHNSCAERHSHSQFTPTRLLKIELNERADIRGYSVCLCENMGKQSPIKMFPLMLRQAIDGEQPLRTSSIVSPMRHSGTAYPFPICLQLSRTQSSLQLC